MADIFISYKKEDAGRVVRIVEGLRTEGFSVWWDHGIAPGSQWDQTIQTELNAAKCVVAIWSELSVSAPWVKEEAGVGKSRGALVPVRIDEVNPPLGFGLIQAADLFDWDGDVEDPHWDFFIESVRAVMTGEPVKGLEKPAKRRRVNFSLVAGALAALVITAGAGVWAVSTGLIGGGAGGPNGAASTGGVSTSTRPSAGEEAMFAKAQASALKIDYQDYLRSFPQGYYAARIREEILPICRGETRPAWTSPSMPLGQLFRAASATEDAAGNPVSFATREAACESAVADFRRSADNYCRAFTATVESRNRKLGVEIAECDCQEIQGDWFCFTDSTYSCTYEFLSEKYVEVCD